MRGNCLLLHSTCAEQAKQVMLALVDLVGSIPVVNKKNFLLIIFKHKRSCFLVFQTPTLCSVGISYLYFLHSNANITSKLLSISCDLEAMNQLVKYSLIRAFRLLKQIFQSLDRLLQEKKCQHLELLLQLELFLLFRDRSSYRESTIDLFLRFLSVFNRQKYDFGNNTFPFSIMIAGIFISRNNNTN